MRTAWVLWAWVALAGCSAIEARQQATTRCRELGFVGSVKDAGTFYCWKDRLDDLPVIPPGAPKATVP